MFFVIGEKSDVHILAFAVYHLITNRFALSFALNVSPKKQRLA